MLSDYYLYKMSILLLDYIGVMVAVTLLKIWDSSFCFFFMGEFPVPPTLVTGGMYLVKGGDSQRQAIILNN